MSYWQDCNDRSDFPIHAAPAHHRFLLRAKSLENITVATSNQIKTMAEEMEKLCVRKIEKLDNTLIEEFTDALSCLAGQLVTISEGFSEDYYRLLEELKEEFAQNDVVSTIDNEAISEGDK